jgi:hypothetical protein
MSKAQRRNKKTEAVKTKRGRGFFAMPGTHQATSPEGLTRFSAQITRRAMRLLQLEVERRRKVEIFHVPYGKVISEALDLMLSHLEPMGPEREAGDADTERLALTA